MRKSHSHAHACADKQRLMVAFSHPWHMEMMEQQIAIISVIISIIYLRTTNQFDGFSYRSDFMHYDKVDNQPKLTCTSDTMNRVY